MKYISVVILIIFMSWTWSLATTERAFSLEEHKRVEAGVEKDIREFILRKHPQTTDLYCQELYTEPVQPGVEMIAHFRCRTEGAAEGFETVTQTFEGEIRLRSADNFQTWTEVGGKIRAPEIAFTRGVEVSSKDTVPPAPEPGTPAQPAAAPQPAPKSEHQ